MSRRKVISAVVFLISLPAVLVAIEAVSFYVHNRANGSIVSSGKTRRYLLYVPRTYDHSRPTPLVISMHGANGWPVQQMELSRWNELADRQGFIVVYPSGMDSAGPRVWHVGEDFGTDVRFISELIDKLEAAYNIDPARIYANGFSNGGGMAFVLSCTLSDRIAAVGMVGAAQTLPWSWCKDRRAVPMIAFHGTADTFALYNGGESWVAPRPFPAVPRWTASWARRNGCKASAESIAAPDVRRREYTNCTEDASVVLYTMQGGGHTWPGGTPMPEWFTGPTSNSINATSVMWAFFRAHRLSRRSGV